MRPMPRPETLKLFLSEREIVEMTARAALVSRMSRPDLVRSAFAPLARAVRKGIASWNAWHRPGSLPDPG